MKISGKWLVRTGALLFLLGFFLPFATVSCSGMMSTPVSLMDLGSNELTGGEPFVYLVPVGALAVLIFSLLPARDGNPLGLFFWLQIAGAALAFLAAIIPILSVYSQIQQANQSVNDMVGGLGNLLGTGGGNLGGMIEYSPNIGSFFLLAGLLCWGAGFVMEFSSSPSLEYAYRSAPPYHEPAPYAAGQYPAPVQSQAYLQCVQGSLAGQMIPLDADFMIGRHSSNSLPLPDPRASRQHARLRYAQGAWFVQDQQSKAGILVNGQPVRASRLQSGDQITIGGTTFVFHE